MCISWDLKNAEGFSGDPRTIVTHGVSHNSYTSRGWNNPQLPPSIRPIIGELFHPIYHDQLGADLVEKDLVIFVTSSPSTPQWWPVRSPPRCSRVFQIIDALEDDISWIFPTFGWVSKWELQKDKGPVFFFGGINYLFFVSIIRFWWGKKTKSKHGNTPLLTNRNHGQRGFSDSWMSKKKNKLYTNGKLLATKNLDGGFKYLLFPPLFGKDSHFD